MTDPLYVITAVSNPVRYRSRYDLYNQFAKHMADAGAILYTTEMAFGHRQFAVTESDNPRHIQVRSAHELWHKENMLNLALQRLPADWKYVAWIDADVLFTRPDWVKETVEQLQHYKFVQLFSHAQDLTPQFEAMKVHTGFVYEYYHNPEKFVTTGDYLAGGHPGYAWAATRSALDAVGGLIDHGVLGSGDRHMACALLGQVENSYDDNVHSNYKLLCQEWQSRSESFIMRNVGYVSGLINHYWHGSKQNRGYEDRWQILVNHQFDPLAHTYKDTQGLLQLKPDPKLARFRDDVRKYFRSRHEDCIYSGEYKLLP